MNQQPQVGLFVTCLVNAMRPSIGFAAVRLLEAAGCAVSVPLEQTCCGQPAFNSGDDEDSRAIAQQLIETFEPFDYLVSPSGSCAGMIRCHLPELFRDDDVWYTRAKALSVKTFEILSFLHDERGFVPSAVSLEKRVTYHDSCSGLRELGVKSQPRALLAHVEGLELVPLEGDEICCGFGGTFCIKYPDISTRIVEDKAALIEATGAQILLAGDLGCLMNMAGRLSRRGSAVRCYHTIEVLAGMAGNTPAIGEAG